MREHIKVGDRVRIKRRDIGRGNWKSKKVGDLWVRAEEVFGVVTCIDGGYYYVKPDGMEDSMDLYDIEIELAK